jgi:hypothetical protein
MSQKSAAEGENATTPVANDPLRAPPPTDRERQEIEIARARLVDRRRPARAKVRSKRYGARSFSSPHADHAGFRTRLADALGTASPDFVDASLHQLVQAVSRCDCPEGGSEMELVLGPMREAKGEPNWRPIRWMEGLAFQAQVGKSLRERFELSQHHGQK